MQTDIRLVTSAATRARAIRGPTGQFSNPRAEGASMRLAEQIEQVGKHGRSQKSDHDGPPDELLMFSTVRSPHAGQEVVAVLLFVLSGPKHSLSPGCRRSIIKTVGFGKPTNIVSCFWRWLVTESYLSHEKVALARYRVGGTVGRVFLAQRG